MRYRLAILAILFGAATAGIAAEAAKISVPELLNPQKRTQALQQFLIASDPDRARTFEWNDLKRFTDWYSDINVTDIPQLDGSLRYLVTARTAIGVADWNNGEVPPSPASRPQILGPQGSLDLWLFGADGGRISKIRDSIRYGIAADIDGDGEVDVVEIEHHSSNELDAEWLVLTPPPSDAEPKFAVLYNMHAKELAVTNSWGFQFVGRHAEKLIPAAQRPAQAHVGLGQFGGSLLDTQF